MQSEYTFQAAQMNSGGWTDHQSIVVQINEKKNIKISKSFQDSSRGNTQIIERAELNDNQDIPESFQGFIHNKLSFPPTWIEKETFDSNYINYLVDIKKIIAMVSNEKKEYIDWNDSLKKQLNDQTKQSEEKEILIKELKEKWSKSEDRRCDLEDDLALSVIENMNLEKNIESLKSEKDKLYSDLYQTSSDLEQTQKIYSEAVESINDLKEENSFFKQKYLETVASKDKLQIEFDESSKNVKELKSTLADILDKYNSVESENVILFKKLNEAKKEYESLTKINMVNEEELVKSNEVFDRFFFYGIILASGAFSYCLGYFIKA